jgi:predicted phosphodiesterase
MPVAALYDIHGNLPALEAVLAEIHQLDVDRIVIGGDVLPGPMPPETLERLQNLRVPTHFLYGNGEIAVLAQKTGRTPSAVPEPYRPVIEWTAQQLDDSHAHLLATWPPTVRLEIAGLGSVLFCHATPRNQNELFTKRTPETRLLPVFETASASVVVCGHTHMQFDRTVGSIRIVNAGSVGMPFGEPGADWLLLGPDVQFRHTQYDLAQAAERVRATEYPQAAQFAAKNILHPPSEAEMLDLFTRASAQGTHSAPPATVLLASRYKPG